ncbi:hypothetical protein Baya_11553 [Bagarius yarrelli]|uniref:Uncharacterized protein n=1 Tax=Bagarius yarrelli TaxID=175774 RepID=A0A556UZL6_BAGYA|nr:hypothetical protein Baya_11553 [Bagarius yarrelli]
MATEAAGPAASGSEQSAVAEAAADDREKPSEKNIHTPHPYTGQGKDRGQRSRSNPRKMKKTLPEMSMARLQQKQTGEGLPQKKKSVKDQLKETQQELRSEREAREALEEEKATWTKERNFWITELKKMEELRQAETRFSEVLRYEEVHKLTLEKDLEQQKLLTDLEDMKKQRDEFEKKKKLEIEAGWREATENWVQKMSRMMDTLEEKEEEMEKLRRTVEELQKELDSKKSETATNLDEEDKKGKEREYHLNKWKVWYSYFTINRRTRQPQSSCLNAVMCSSEQRNCCMSTAESVSLDSTQFQAYTGL